MIKGDPGTRRLWQTVFFCFILAAVTGVLFRFGMIVPLPDVLSLQNVRHAHSHLMFFGWATPLPLYIFWKRLRTRIEPVSGKIGLDLMYGSLWGILLFGLLSYPFFLLYGYQPVPLGSTTLPLSVICSGLVMIGWYGYIAGYLMARKQVGRSFSQMWFEAALLMLFICSLGAWGVAVTQALDTANPLFGKALTHFFLACFTEGWIVLITVALLAEALNLNATDFRLSPNLLAGLILVGAPMTFPYGISQSLMTLPMLYTARAGGFLVGMAVLGTGLQILRSDGMRRSLLRWPLALLLLKAVMQVTASVIPSDFWLSDYALRILYLHILLLGAFTLAGIGFMHRFASVKTRSFTGVVFSVLILLISLLMLTRFWPAGWSGIWLFYAITGASLLPAIAVGVEWRELARTSV